MHQSAQELDPPLALHGSLWQCLEWLKINGKSNIISITDAANPAIYLWLSYSLWELTM
jgi:hypothetical protein